MARSPCPSGKEDRWEIQDSLALEGEFVFDIPGINE